jgi:hypothetical protein
MDLGPEDGPMERTNQGRVGRVGHSRRLSAPVAAEWAMPTPAGRGFNRARDS